MTYRKIIALTGLLMLAPGLSGCLQLFGGSRGGGVGVNIELPKFSGAARADNRSATLSPNRL